MTRHDATDNMGKDATLDTADLTSLSRRRLLKLGAYVPPAIVGMAIISSMPDAAQAGGKDKDKGGGGHGSCNPNACNPCIGGKKQTNRDKRDCRIARKKRRR